MSVTLPRDVVQIGGDLHQLVAPGALVRLELLTGLRAAANQPGAWRRLVCAALGLSVPGLAAGYGALLARVGYDHARAGEALADTLLQRGMRLPDLEALLARVAVWFLEPPAAPTADQPAQAPAPAPAAIKDPYPGLTLDGETWAQFATRTGGRGANGTQDALDRWTALAAAWKATGNASTPPAAE